MSPKPDRLTDHYLDTLEADVAALRDAVRDLPAIRADLDEVKARPRTALSWVKDGLQMVTFAAAVAAILQRVLAPVPALASPQADPEAIARRAAEVAVEAMARQQSTPGAVKPAKYTPAQ